jgi:hypothetical protein
MLLPQALLDALDCELCLYVVVMAFIPHISTLPFLVKGLGYPLENVISTLERRKTGIY